MLQVESIFAKPSTGNSAVKARIQKRHFEVEEGDLITYLNVFMGFVREGRGKEFCHRNFVSYKSMKRVAEIRERLARMAQNYDVPLISCDGNYTQCRCRKLAKDTSLICDSYFTGHTEVIQKCLVTGLFANAVYLHHSGVYKTVRGDVELYVHPDSVLYTVAQPQW